MSPTAQLVVGAIVTILVAIAGSSAAAAWINTRATRQQRTDEAPERREALTVEGSAMAVLTMSSALEAANDRAEQAERDVAEVRADLHAVKVQHRQEIDDLRTEHNREITDLRARFDRDLAAVRADLEAYRTQPNTGGTT